MLGYAQRRLSVVAVVRRFDQDQAKPPLGSGNGLRQHIEAPLMYNADKGFGFVGQDGGGKDVFVHATTLERDGLSRLIEGQRVRMQVGQGQRGLEVRSIKLLD